MTSVSADCIRLTQTQPVNFCKNNCCTHLANAAKEWLIDLEPRCKSVEKKTSIFSGLNEEFSAGGKKVYCDNKFKRVWIMEKKINCGDIFHFHLKQFQLEKCSPVLNFRSAIFLTMSLWQTGITLFQIHAIPKTQGLGEICVSINFIYEKF